MNLTIGWLFNQSRKVKRIISLVLDTLFIVLAFWGAYVLRLDTTDYMYSSRHWLVLVSVVPVTLLCFVKLGLYRAVLRYLGYKAFTTMASGIMVSVIAMVMAAYYFDAFMPRSVPVIYALLTFLLCGGARSFARALYNQSVKRNKTPVIIYGAGASGRQLCTSLYSGHEYRTVAFVDDNPVLQGMLLHGVAVYSPEELSFLTERYGVQKLLLAMPSINRQQRRDIVDSLETLPLDILSIPGMADVVSGKAKLTELHEVSVEDLLGRDPVEPYPELISANIQNKVVMVTGAGGSIGSELCRQIVQQKPITLIMYELSEFALYQIDLELRQWCDEQKVAIRLVPLLGSVHWQPRVEMVMHTYGVQTVYHAAAFKHVPLVEHNVVEGVRNNVFGTWYTAEAAIKAGVENFVLISTDKAVRPTNVMGTSKRLAELVLQALASRQKNTRFCMVRFGNVLGSSGSVVPLFKKQIRAGGPITLTHPDITRYFMTIPEAAQLVIQAGAMGKGGDVFVLDMGEPVKIIDLARKMVRLMGFEVKDEQHPDGDIAIDITGLRPGEKLYEELLIGESEQPTAHPRIRTANEVFLPWEKMKELLDNLDEACRKNDQKHIRELLLNAPTAFTPQGDICDLVWQQSMTVQHAKCSDSEKNKVVAMAR